jgi:uncharacterized metal-binding protein YceD (DUF177 family)
MSEAPILSRVVNVAEPPAAKIAIVAGEAERQKLAVACDVVAVNGLSATVTLTPGAKGGVTVDGQVIADIVQTCVVSLVPVEQHIDETFSVRYVRGAEPQPKPGSEIVIDATLPDPPEILTGPTLDVGELVEEYFALAIDPYPRAPGAALPADFAAGGDDDEASPFAALAALIKPPGKQG